MAPNLLSNYHEKRNFGITSEPKGKPVKSKDKLHFVVQLHEATRTHYDFRLEWDGVMKSWAVTKGPSFDPADKRLAVRTEDHPIDYNKFEGVIPAKQYGAGPVMIWDEGLWLPDNDPQKMEKKGHISFTIFGSRLKGHWHLVRMKTEGKRENWLLIKGDDQYVLNKKNNASFLKHENTSIKTGRTMDDIRAGTNDATPKAGANNKNAKTVPLTTLIKNFKSPELATLIKAPPTGDDWVHEIKYDGYRLIAFLSDGKVTLQTRGGKDWTHKFQPLADAIAKLKVANAVLDLEACVLNGNGKTDFSALQAALTDNKMEKIQGWVFDLLYLDGQDFTKKPLLERKAALKKLLQKSGPQIFYSEHFESKEGILEHACKIGAEGLVSKRKDSHYLHRRTKDWLKSKCGLEQEFVIGGYMPAKDNNKAIGALLLGYYKGKKLHYAGKVGTGYTRKIAADIFNNLQSLVTEEAPFVEKIPRGERKYVYVKPERLAQVTFLEWTADKHIRHASFKGLREDKPAADVKEEKPVALKTVKATGKSSPNMQSTSKNGLEFYGVKITHPDREVYPGTGITKGDVAAYYETVAPLMLPYLKGRLISLLRCTDGIKGECFFQRNPARGLGKHVKSKSITHKGKKHTYLYIEDETGLMELVQMGTIEFHAWQSHVQTIGKPDQIIFDLDPDDSVPFEAVKLAAEDVRRRLKKHGLDSLPRLTGGKGIHVVADISPELGWDDVKEFARMIAEEMEKEVPAAFVANMSKAKRKGKIFVDFFRNDYSATAIVPFSLRARESAPIAWPISWAELKKQKKASAFTLKSLSKKNLEQAKKHIQN
jgi:bifunctional non-homologous end joining protein LigD